MQNDRLSSTVARWRARLFFRRGVTRGASLAAKRAGVRNDRLSSTVSRGRVRLG